MEVNLLSDNSWRRLFIVFGLIIIIIIFMSGVIKHFDYTPDDTYIYLQYAKNILNGNGISFNAGEPTYGVTSPLWLFIISVTGKFGFDLYTSAKVLDLLFSILSILIFFLVIENVVANFAISLCGTITFSLNVWFLRWSGTGMETSLALFLFLIAMLYAFKKNYSFSAVITALLTMVRPEAWIMILLVLLAIYIFEDDNVKFRKIFLVLSLYIGLSLPWLVYAYFIFGTIIPNTALAKAGLTFKVDDGFSTLTDILQTIIFSDGISILFFIIGGILMLFKNKNLYMTDEEKHRWFIGVGFIILFPLFYVITGVNVVSRYLLLVTPLILIFAYKFLYNLISFSKVKRFSYAVILTFTAVVMLQSQILYHKHVKTGIDTFEQGMELCLIPIGRWLKSNTDPSAIIFAQDIGAIGYYSERKVCDAAGLISPDMLKLLRNGYTYEQMMKEKIYESLCKADYIVYRSFETEEFSNNPNLTYLFTKVFPQMGLAENKINYYTVYKVRHISN